MDLGIAGRVALVMGATRGIGRAAASCLAREGAAVAIVGRSSEHAQEAAAAIAGEHSAPTRAFTADTSDVDVLPALVEDVAGALGPVEILVTNTGGPPVGAALSFDRDAWEAAYRSLVLAPLTLIESVVPAMRKRGFGRIVNVTSLGTREPIPGLVLSNSHRAAAVGLFKTLADELARDGILLNSVAPGLIATDRIASMRGKPLEELRDEPQPDIPVGRLGRPQEAADVIAFLCSERASYLCGLNLPVDGGRLRST